MSSVSASPTRLKFWGTRGSISVPGQGTLRYGGNTTCVELRADGEIIVLDAGTGIRELGEALAPGQALLCVLVSSAEVAALREALEPYGDVVDADASAVP